MRLSESVAAYVAYKRALGMCFNTEAHILASFCRYLGDVPIASITADEIQHYLDGEMPVSSYWQRKYTALAGLYRFALARGDVSTSPFPFSCPRLPPPLVPYIYSTAELKRLLDATPAVCTRLVPFDADVLRNLLLLLYGACLRPSEGRKLAMQDIDLDHAVLCIRATKFYKTRLVPLGIDLNTALNHYVQQRNLTFTDAPDTPFFCCREGHALSKSSLGSAFRRLRIAAGVERQHDARYQPRLHDLQHTMATKLGTMGNLRVLQEMLGHKNILTTQRYVHVGISNMRALVTGLPEII